MEGLSANVKGRYDDDADMTSHGVLHVSGYYYYYSLFCAVVAAAVTGHVSLCFTLLILGGTCL